MTTTPGAAGTAKYNPAASKLITRAFRDMGVIDETEQPTAAMMADGMDKANLLLKAWQALGIHVWTEEEAILFLQQGQVRYLLGDPGGDFTPDRAVDAFAYQQTVTAFTAGAGASTLTLSSVAGLADGMAIGVGLDSGATQWTTISGAPNGSTVQLAAPLAGSASAGAYVFAYAAANAITRPLKVPFARRLAWAPAGSLAGPNEIPIWVMSRKDYMAQPNKLSQGQPTQIFYAPKEGFGELFVWPTPTDASCAIRFTWMRPIADLLSQASTADLPQEWLNVLEWSLAKELGPSYEVPPVKWDRILLMANQGLDMAQSWDRETEEVQFGYDDQARW